MATDYERLTGQAGRNPAWRFARYLRDQGFLPTQHFIVRFLQRVVQEGVRLDPRTFRSVFLRARHFRQTRPGFNTRAALLPGRILVLYRKGGWNGRQIVLVTTWDAQKRLPPLTPVPAPSLESSFEDGYYEDGFYETPPQHGSLYQRHRQVFLKKLKQSKKHPAFMTGWIKQEMRRRQQARQGRPAGFTVSGQAQTAERFKQLQRILSDPATSEAARKWALRQLARLKRGQQRLQDIRAGVPQRVPNVRGVPGYDVGHPIGRKPGEQNWRKFRTEMATQNRARPSIARRLGLDPRVYG